MASFVPKGVFRILGDVDELIGAKIKTHKSSLNQKLTPKKSYTELHTDKIIQLKSSQLRKYLPHFSYPKRIPELKILNPKNPSIIAVTWNPDYLNWSFVPPQIS